MKIITQKNGSFNDADRLELAKLLIKAGYTVKIGKEKQSSKASVTYVEFLKEGEVSYE